jgi:hypothetical protein
VRAIAALLVLATLSACRTWGTVAPADLDGDHAFVVSEADAYELDDATASGPHVKGTAIHAWHIRSCKFTALGPADIAQQCGGVPFEPPARQVRLETRTIQYAQTRYVSASTYVVAVLLVAIVVVVGGGAVIAHGVHK